MPGLNLASAEPATATRTPQPGLKELAEGFLRRSPYLALKHVACDYHDGVLTLRGRLPSYYLKQRAQEAVAGIGGVERVANEIEVTTLARGASEGGRHS
jgi:osmotically-inducible protein OsmY